MKTTYIPPRLFSNNVWNTFDHIKIRRPTDYIVGTQFSRDERRYYRPDKPRRRLLSSSSRNG